MTIPISAYEPFFSDKQQRICPGGRPYEYDFYQFMEGIKHGDHKAIIEQCRAITDKHERSVFKAQNLLAVTLSCTCHTWRKEANIQSHSGLMGIDVDPEENIIDDWGALRDAIVDRLPVVAAALSASGQGVFFVVRVPKDISLHRDVYNYISWAFEQAFGLRVDPTGKNPDRLRFTSLDPDCYINYNIDSLPIIVPDAEYWERRAKHAALTINLLPATSADSINVFKTGIRIAETPNEKRPAYFFVDGQKHPFLVTVAGYCNARGMTLEQCQSHTVRLFAAKTSITIEHLLIPIKNVYNSYSATFGKYPLPAPIYMPIKHKRWLLQRVNKDYIRKNIHLYNRSIIYGPEPETIRVSNRLLVFLMHLYSPKYTWTCEQVPGSELSNEQCAGVFRDDAKIDISAGEVIFVDKIHNYPKDWDA